MGFLDSFKDFFKPIANAISSVLKNTPLMTALMPILAVVIPPPFDIIAVVALMAISAAMGVEEEPEKLGFQMQEADKGPEDFDSFKEYKEYLDKNYPFDQAKFDALDDAHKQACRYVGLAGTLAELKEEKGFEMSGEMLGMLTRGCQGLGMDSDATATLAANLAKTDENIFTDLEDAVNARLDPDKDDNLMANLEQALKESDSKVTDPDDFIGALRSNNSENL